MAMIQYIGLNDLSEAEQSKVKLAAERELEKCQINVADPLLVINFKQVAKGGSQKEFNIKARLESSSGNFEASHMDYDLQKTLHKVFEHLSNRVKHKLRVDDGIMSKKVPKNKEEFE